MKKYLSIVLFVLMSFGINAQDDLSGYLGGAVPEVDGKVVFLKVIMAKKKITDEQIFQLMDKWAKDNYEVSTNKLQNRILLSSLDEKNIACLGEEYLVFGKGVISLDRAKMIYRLIIEVKDGGCNVTVRNIKYDYSDKKGFLLAEDMITDKVPLDKKKTKLNRYYDKFRMRTIDSINSIFKSIDTHLNETVISNQNQSVVPNSVATVAPIPVQVIDEKQSVIANAVSSHSMVGFKQIAPDKIPGNVIKLLSDAMLITSGTGSEPNVMAASWGGLGRFWEKPVAFCFLNPTRYSVQTMDKGDTYTLSFYTEAYKEAVLYCGSVSGRDTDKIKTSGLTPIRTPSGATAFSEAWMILECRKIVAQPISADAVVDKNLSGDWGKNGYHKMYIGEILNVWIK